MIFPKGETKSLLTGVSDISQMRSWIKKAEDLSKQHNGRVMVVQFAPRTHFFEVSASVPINTGDNPYPKQGESPSVCDFLNAGD